MQDTLCFTNHRLTGFSALPIIPLLSLVFPTPFSLTEGVQDPHRNQSW